MARDVKVRFGSLVRACRLDNEMSQEDLADALGVHQPSVSAWELGRTLPVLKTIVDIAELYGLPLPTDLVSVISQERPAVCLAELLAPAPLPVRRPRTKTSAGA